MLRATLKIRQSRLELDGESRLFEVEFIIKLTGAFLLGKEEKNLSLISPK